MIKYSHLTTEHSEHPQEGTPLRNAKRAHAIPEICSRLSKPVSVEVGSTEESRFVVF